MADHYRCVATQETISHQISAEIYVPLNGASPEPYLNILKTKDGVLLLCKVRGASPEPEVKWEDSDGNMITSEEPQVTKKGGSYDIILHASVTKTDHYRCVVTQKTINHSISDKIYVPLNAGSQTHPSDQNLRKVMIGVAVVVLAEFLFL
ncbi:butyrophilin-like protein 1 [Perca fluviatilis]|uniref:butyrophilin-like protein 1 n=1 Tax=Perca fluviatilis TaxID=8168 RepID=UPI001965988F|nr:butyrophilin-like protein 1 [Perca fluviatilis]